MDVRAIIFNPTVFLLLSTVLGTVVYYNVCTVAFKIENKVAIWTSTIVFFLLFGYARVFIYFRVATVPLINNTEWGRYLVHLLHTITEVGFYIALFFIIRAIYRKILVILGKGKDNFK